MSLTRITYRRNAGVSNDWIKQQEYEKQTIYTDIVGFIIYEDDFDVAIAQSRSPLDETGEVLYSGIVTITTGNIEMRQKLVGE